MGVYSQVPEGQKTNSGSCGGGNMRKNNFRRAVSVTGIFAAMVATAPNPFIQRGEAEPGGKVPQPVVTATVSCKGSLRLKHPRTAKLVKIPDSTGRFYTIYLEDDTKASFINQDDEGLVIHGKIASGGRLAPPFAGPNRPKKILIDHGEFRLNDGQKMIIAKDRCGSGRQRTTVQTRAGLKNGSLATGRKERGLRGKEVEGN